ncbi:MAG: hypothetical protein R2939_10360 [Kofleriaceae bacterium]
MTRAPAGALALLLLGACGVNPPADIHGASGDLDASDPACFIYPAEGYASIYLDDDATLEVTLPPVPDVWGRGGAVYAELDDDACAYAVDLGGVRVQYGSEAIGDPDCDHCSTRYRALFVEGLVVPETRACSGGFGCDGSECRTVAPARADRFAVWCDSPDEFGL